MPRWRLRVAGAVLGLLLVPWACRLLVSAQAYAPPEEEEAGPELTPSPPVTPHPPPRLEEVLPICPPRRPAPILQEAPLANLLLVSTLDGQLSALDLAKDGEMFWSVSTYPGPMLSSTISKMDLDSRGQFIKLIPSLNGRLYKFNGEVVEPIPLNVDSLLGTSLKMQENMVVTGGKESRTYGIVLETGQISYECSMNECTHFQEQEPTKDMLVVQRNTQTVRAHVPRTGEQKWNFSVSLHDVSFHPAPEDPCGEPPHAGDGSDDDSEEAINDDLTTVRGGGSGVAHEDVLLLKAVVPEGLICGTDEQGELVRWRRKFPSPIVDVWRLRHGRLERVDLFAKQHIPQRRPAPAGPLLDDDDVYDEDEENPFLYIGSHQSQLYIQESVRLRTEADSALAADQLAAADPSSLVAYPRVTWRPYLVSPSRTPVINHGAERPEVALLTFQQTTIMRGDAQSTALAITTNSGEYPYDSGFYLYPDTTSLNSDDPLSNITSILHQTQSKEEAEEEAETTVEFIYMGLSHYWKEVLFISLLTGVLMNVMITRPIIHEMRDNFQQRSRELVHHFETNKEVREVTVEVPVPTQIPITPSTTGTTGSSGPSFGEWDRQNSDFSSRYLADFEPVQCLGRGGFGVVFESKNKIDDIHYAVKRITLPNSEASKKKVMREVKLHAKLDHKNIVRYYSTWLETPPPGWQEQADSWFDDTDLGTGPTSWDPTASSAPCSQSEPIAGRQSEAGHRFKQRQPQAPNPLRPFSGVSQSSCYIRDNKSGQTSGWDPSGDNSFRFSNTCDMTQGSFSITFEDSGGGGGGGCGGGDGRGGDGGRAGGGESSDSDDERSADCEQRLPRSPSHRRSRRDVSCAESTGGIRFQDSYTQNLDGDFGTEERGEVEMVALDMEEEDEQEEGGSLSCYEALDWEENHNVIQSQENPVKPKSYLYIVMQLCKKETLRDWLKNNMDREQRTIFRFFHQLCVGVDYVHNQGLIHRDLKPCNIYFSPDGCIKIGDFGLVTGTNSAQPGIDTPQTSRKVEGSEMRERLTEQVGTQLYMSPEQLAQRPYNHRVDIFSLGLIFLELLVPFSTQMERLRVLSEGKQGRYPALLDTHQEIRQLLGLMLNHNPELRPEAHEILQLPWIQEFEERPPAPRPRRNTSGVDILTEELLDN